MVVFIINQAFSRMIIENEPNQSYFINRQNNDLQRFQLNLYEIAEFLSFFVCTM